MGYGATLSLKILSFLILTAILAFFYLFFTMENEEIFQKEIANNRAHISAQQEIISKLDHEKRQILRKIKSFENKNLTREEKIMILDLDMKVYKIDDDLQKVEGEIDEYEKKIMDNRKTIEELINSPFIKRLLRQ